jgi:hypothetical protein
MLWSVAFSLFLSVRLRFGYISSFPSFPSVNSDRFLLLPFLSLDSAVFSAELGRFLPLPLDLFEIAREAGHSGPFQGLLQRQPRPELPDRTHPLKRTGR